MTFRIPGLENNIMEFVNEINRDAEPIPAKSRSSKFR
jgi:hypothetical protein